MNKLINKKQFVIAKYCSSMMNKKFVWKVHTHLLEHKSYIYSAIIAKHLKYICESQLSEIWYQKYFTHLNVISYFVNQNIRYSRGRSRWKETHDTDKVVQNKIKKNKIKVKHKEVKLKMGQVIKGERGNLGKIVHNIKMWIKVRERKDDEMLDGVIS